jgi:YVTN family beta-propeller protein
MWAGRGQLGLLFVGALLAVAWLAGSGSAVLAQAALPPIELPVPAQGVAVDPTTNRVYVSISPELRSLDGETRAVLGRYELTARMGPVAVNAPTNRIYTGMIQGPDAGIVVLDSATLQLLATVPLEIPSPNETDVIAVNPTTNRIYVVSSNFVTRRDVPVTVLDGATNTIIDTIPPLDPDRHGALSIAINPTTNRLYLPHFETDSVAVLDGTTHAVLATVPVGGFPSSVAVNSTTDRVYVTNARDGTLSVLDGPTNTTLATVPVGARPFYVATNPITNRVYVASNDPGGRMLTIVDGATDTVVARLPLPGRPVQLAVNAATSRVYVATTDAPGLQVFEDTPSAPAR